MPSKLKRANKQLRPLMRELIDGYHLHEQIDEFDVKVDFLFAWAEQDDHGQKKGPALKHRGVPALGICRIVNYRDRVKGCGDVEISVDADWWEAPTTTHEQQLALLDHELRHIKVLHDTDQANRPKIKMRPHDFEVGWFHDVAERWGVNSNEVQQAQVLIGEKLKSVYFEYQPELFDKVVGIDD